ncbi:MAG: hypothetical protein KBS89_08700 [Bacteroidales bacterium]|nr:hypothetical protein [Candidatus Egerieousia equi]
MKNIERKFVEGSTSYAPPRMRMAFVSNNTLLCQSGSDITDAEEEEQDIFGE